MAQQRVSKVPKADTKFIKNRQPTLFDEKRFKLSGDDGYRTAELQKLKDLGRVYQRRIPSGDSEDLEESPSRAAAARRTGESSNQADYERTALERASINLDSRSDAIRNQVAQMELLKSLIVEDSTHCDEDKAKKNREIVEDLEYSIYSALARLGKILLHRHRITGSVVDDFMRESFNDPISKAYVDMLVEKRMNKISGAKRSFETNKEQRNHHKRNWKSRLSQHYNAADPTDPQSFWCPISHGYLPSGNMTAAHMVPNALGEHNARHLFGKADDSDNGHLYDVGNGLLLCTPIEKALDEARIAILPANIVNPKFISKIDGYGGMPGNELNANKKDSSEHHDDGEAAADPTNHGMGSSNNPGSKTFDSGLTVVLLDQTIAQHRITLNLKFIDIANRKLLFKHPTHRPRFRYLYFLFCSSLLARRTFEGEGWKKDWVRYLHQKFWGTPDKEWLRKSSIVAIMKEMGAIRDMFEILDGKGMPTFEMDEEDTARRDDLAAVTFHGMMTDMQLRAEGVIVNESDDEEDDGEEDDGSEGGKDDDGYEVDDDDD